MYLKTNIRMPQGDLPDPCPGCGGKLAGSQASKKYRKEVMFIHTYEDKDCTRWISTEVYHPECGEKSLPALRERVLELL